MTLNRCVVAAWFLVAGVSVAGAQVAPQDDAGHGLIALPAPSLLDQAPTAVTQPDPAGPDLDAPRRGFFSEMFHGMFDAVKHMPRRNTLYWLGGGAALALAVHPEDKDINDRLKGSSIADTAYKPGKYIGSLPVLFATATTTYIVGRAGDHPRARHLGMDMIQATLLSEVITESIKVSVRRKRPLHDDGTRNSGYAFPSGHSTMTFAVATVLQQHLGWKAAVPTYAVAAYVATSRLHDNRHYASDVVMGAANGIIIGRSITWHGRNFYASALPVPGGVGVGVQVGAP